jgi:hypothetical protein
MPTTAAELAQLKDALKALVQQVEGLEARAAQEELTAGREGYAAPRLTRKA